MIRAHRDLVVSAVPESSCLTPGSLKDAFAFCFTDLMGLIMVDMGHTICPSGCRFG